MCNISAVNLYFDDLKYIYISKIFMRRLSLYRNDYDDVRIMSKYRKRAIFLCVLLAKRGNAYHNIRNN